LLKSFAGLPCCRQTDKFNSHDQEPQNEAGRQFNEWTSLFSGKFFVMLSVYADESGTHDPGFNKPGARVPVISGFIDTVENWKIFCNNWKALLDEYKVPYFHFREIKWERMNPKSPYCGRSDDKIDDFIYDMAMVAGKTAIPVGGHCDGGKSLSLQKGENPYETTFREFFNSVVAAINTHWACHEKPDTEIV
jgi:hypothetical protein